MEPSIVYEDQLVCVIEKPTGLVVNDSMTIKTGETVQSWFKNRRVPGGGEYEKKGGVVHRLDKDTSGLMILAKTEQAYSHLKQQFLNRQVFKSYLALVHGSVQPAKQIISLPIGRNPANPKQFTVVEDKAKTAITQWQVDSEFKNNKTGEIFSLLRLFPLTGRTHQLRVHLKHFHHPIVSDPIYGYRKTGKNDLDWCPRLFLHADQLELYLPGNLEKKRWEVLLPKDLQFALDYLDKIESN
jgi:23S rRNA pseudouridine1911/1915/1917 synthase